MLRLGNQVVEPFVVEMLQSADERMRLTGVWVVRQSRLRGYRELLHAMSRLDPSERVRGRSEQAVLQLDKPRTDDAEPSSSSRGGP